MRAFRPVPLVALALCVAQVSGCGREPSGREQRGIESGPDFSATPLGTSYALFDLGVADVDADGWLDLYTSNHSALQQLRLGRAGGGLSEDRLSALRLDQDPRFPGLEVADQEPALDAPGMYVLFHRSVLALLSHALPEGAVRRGRIELPWRVVAAARGELGFDLDQRDDARGVTRAVIGLHRCLPGPLCRGRRLVLSRMRRWLPGLALRTGLQAPDAWSLAQYRNRSPRGHWLHVDLIGPPGNRTALGTSVRLHAGGRMLLRVVGQAEGAHFSQGQHRLYFGLGELARVDRLEVRWSDGRIQTLASPPVDRRMRVHHPSSTL